MQEAFADKARQIIINNNYMCLATIGERPWAAPVYYSFDEHFIFYFVSAIDSNHAQHITANQQVALAIYDSTAPAEERDGVQIEGIASMVEEGELPHVLDNYYLRRFPDETERRKHNLSPQKFLTESNLRFFKINPQRFYTLDSRSVKVDRSVEVFLTRR